MNRQLLVHAFNYKQWADTRTLEAIAKIDAKKAAGSIAFFSQQLNHMVMVEELFRARLLGLEAPHDSTNTPRVPPLAELARRLARSDRWFLDFSSTVEPPRLEEAVRFQFTDGKNGSMTRLEILFHVINHGTYHRGAMSHALDLAGVAHPADAYTTYIHSAEPGRREAT